MFSGSASRPSPRISTCYGLADAGLYVYPPQGPDLAATYAELMPILEKIVVSDFRNIDFQEIMFSPNVNCISGNNGEGKTNLLDAIYYLSMTKSAFATSDRYIFRHGKDSFSICGTYLMESSGDSGRLTSRFAVQVNAGGEKKLKKDDKVYDRISSHIGELPVVMVSPSDISLVSESGEERRRFANSVLSQMDREYLNSAQQYNRLLSQRNRLLKDRRPDRELLSVFGSRMAPHAERIHSSRARFIEELSPVVAGYYRMLSEGRETVGISYRSDLEKCSLEEAFEASAEKDAIDYFTSTKNCDALDGGLAIFAAGNEMYRTSVYPGAYKDYISVTAMSCDYTPAYYTNYGPGCNIAAPGGDVYQSYLERGSEASQVYSTVNGGEYGYMQGTSMACPHVSGVAALGLSYALQLGRTFSHDEYVSLLLTSVNSIDGYCTGSKTYFDDYGYRRTLSLSPFAGKMGTGYIDAFQVLMNVRGTTCIPVPVGTQTGVDIKEYVGDGNAAFEIISAGFSDDDMKSLGIREQPTIFADKILFTCGKTGSGILTVKLKAGTDGSSGISGMTIEKEFAIVARMSHSENGGWL